MLYKYVYDGEGELKSGRWFTYIGLRRLLDNGLFLGNVCKSFTWNTFIPSVRKKDPSCMILSLYPVMDTLFCWIKENTRVNGLCSSSPRDVLHTFSVQSGSQWQPSCKYLQAALSSTVIQALTLHLLASLNKTVTLWTPRDKHWPPACVLRPCKEQIERLFPPPELVSWFLAMQYPQEKM